MFDPLGNPDFLKESGAMGAGGMQAFLGTREEEDEGGGKRPAMQKGWETNVQGKNPWQNPGDPEYSHDGDEEYDFWEDWMCMPDGCEVGEEIPPQTLEEFNIWFEGYMDMTFGGIENYQHMLALQGVNSMSGLGGQGYMLMGLNKMRSMFAEYFRNRNARDGEPIGGPYPLPPDDDPLEP